MGPGVYFYEGTKGAIYVLRGYVATIYGFVGCPCTVHIGT